jgi:hypothetical protein
MIIAVSKPKCIQAAKKAYLCIQSAPYRILWDAQIILIATKKKNFRIEKKK